MSHTRFILATAGLLLAAIAIDARAQENLPFGPENYSQDFQLFAPVQIDINDEPYTEDYGYYANYNKLIWSYSGERITVGDPTVFVLAERIYVQNQTDLGTLPAPYQIKNGLTDVPPDAGFAFGNRYEVGYKWGGNGWEIGILDGPDLHQNQVYGFGLDPPLDPNYRDNAGIPVGAAGSGAPQADFDLRGFGFGSVHVNFATPPGYLQGFRDYLNFLATATIGTQVGPVVYVGNYGASTEAAPTNNTTQTITVFRVADDINENGIPGSIIVVDPNTGGLTTITDFGDLHEFNIAFHTVTVHNRTETDGIEAMWKHELTNRHYMAKHQNNRLEVSYGARFLRLYDQFDVTGLGGILDSSFWDTSINNQIVGPQLGAKWTNQRQRWTFEASTKCLLGYNTEDWHQVGGIGRGFVPGALNRPAYAQPTYFNHALQRDDFSPVGELRLSTAYYISESVKFQLGYTGMFVGNIRRAAPSVLYSLPDMGYKEAGTQDLLSNGFDFGVEVVY